MGKDIGSNPEGVVSDEATNDQLEGTLQASPSAEQSIDQDSAAFTEVDRESLTDEGKVLHDQLRADYTQKTQELAVQRKQFEAHSENARLGQMVMDDPELRGMVGRRIAGESLVPQPEPTQTETQAVEIPAMADDPEAYFNALLDVKLDKKFGEMIPMFKELQDGFSGMQANRGMDQDVVAFQALQKEYPASQNLTKQEMDIMRSQRQDRSGNPLSYEDTLYLMAKDTPELIVKAASLATPKKQSTVVEMPNQKRAAVTTNNTPVPNRIQEMQNKIRASYEDGSLTPAAIQKNIRERIAKLGGD